MSVLPAQLADDRQTLEQVRSGLDALDQSLDEARVSMGGTTRGYFTPDEDDRVRQMLLAYRNYRLTVFEIIDRYRGYERVADPADRLRAFIVGYAAALTLYASSLKLIQVCGDEPVVRAKLNEPEPGFDLAGGFFDAVLASYTSLANYAAIVGAGRFWHRHRREVRRYGIEQEPGMEALSEVIRRLRPAVRRGFYRALGERFLYRFGALRDLLIRPVADARYGLQALAGSALGQLHLPAPPPCIDAAALDVLRPCLRPGDVLLMRTERKLTTAVFPGFWIHSALYLGSAEDIDRPGFLRDPRLAAHAGAVDTGGSLGVVLQAIAPRVVITPLSDCLAVDHVAVLRPALSEDERTEVVREALGHVGKPYDFEFDFAQSHRLVCTGLIYRAYDGRGAAAFSLVRRFGRYTLTCDELCAQALPQDGRGPASGFTLAALMLQAADGRPHLFTGPTGLAHLRRIQGGMRPSKELTVA